jgi:hypothetical protein
MHVAIDDHHPLDHALLDQPHRDNGQVVEDAITRTGRGERMMAAAGTVRGITAFQRE